MTPSDISPYAFDKVCGSGGGAFPGNCRATIKRVRIRSGTLVDSIQITYRLRNGKYYTDAHHGGTGGGLHTFNVNVGKGERITGVFGRSGKELDQLGFITNWGRIFGPYGGNGGGYFNVNRCNVRGVFGRSGSRIDGIGFFCGRP